MCHSSYTDQEFPCESITVDCNTQPCIGKDVFRSHNPDLHSYVFNDYGIQ